MAKSAGKTKLQTSNATPSTMNPVQRVAVKKRETIKIFFQLYPGVTGDDAKRGIPGLEYVITRSDGSIETGTTDATGALEYKAALDEDVELHILGTDYMLIYVPVTEDPKLVEGAARRLSLLGYNTIKKIKNSPTIKKIDQGLDHAILCFQVDHGLQINGEIERFTTPGGPDHIGIHSSVQNSGYAKACFSDPFAQQIQSQAGI